MSAPGAGGSREAPPDRGAAAAVLGACCVRVPIMALGMLALVSALAGGLARLGWPLPVAASLVAFHGPVMVAGFLGTVIGLERAVALGRRGRTAVRSPAALARSPSRPMCPAARS